MEFYDDPNFSYLAFWPNRKYEHEAEILAIQRLLGSTQVDIAADIGGGYGRLVGCIFKYAKKVVLIEPSILQRNLAEKIAPLAVIKEGNSTDTGLSTRSCDLVVIVRLAHHLPILKETMKEAYRILKPGGILVFEFANSNHFRSRLRYLFKFHSIPLQPIQVNEQQIEVPFVNHHPATVKKSLHQEGFIIHGTLSVSNLRSTVIKKVFKIDFMLALENLLQKPLAKFYFGPSIFILATKPKNI